MFFLLNFLPSSLLVQLMDFPSLEWESKVHYELAFIYFLVPTEEFTPSFNYVRKLT